MADTLHDLGNLLIRSVPTVLFFIFLTYYLKAVLFRPLAAILEERRKATEGVRELAQRAIEAANRKNSEFEYALQLARGELQAKHDAKRREWADEQARVIAEARADADRQIAEIKGEVAGEVKRTETELDSQVERLGQQIVDSLLRRRAA
jgi:F0F1-type ATP synthase membrane subunit b/b'